MQNARHLFWITAPKWALWHFNILVFCRVLAKPRIWHNAQTTTSIMCCSCCHGSVFGKAFGVHLAQTRFPFSQPQQPSDYWQNVSLVNFADKENRFVSWWENHVVLLLFGMLGEQSVTHGFALNLCINKTMIKAATLRGWKTAGTFLSQKRASG